MAGPCLADTSCIHLTFDPVTGTMSATPVVPGAGPGGGGNGVACTPTGLVAEKIDSPTVTWSGGPGQLIAAINQAGISAGLTPSGALCNEITNPGDGLYSENDFMLQGRMAGMSTQDDAQPSTLQSLDPYAGAALIPPTPLGGFVARPSGTNDQRTPTMFAAIRQTIRAVAMMRSEAPLGSPVPTTMPRCRAQITAMSAVQSGSRAGANSSWRSNSATEARTTPAP